MSVLGVAIRALSTGAGLLIVGVLVMSLLAAPSDKPTARAWQRRLAVGTRWLAALLLLSGIATLGLQVSVATGRLDSILSGAAWLRLLGDTQYGTVWLVRHALLLLMAALVLFQEHEASTGDWIAWRAEAGLLAVVGVGLAAWSGHAVGVDPGRAWPVLVNATHLVAVGAWLGALPALALLLRAASREDGADSRPFAVIATRRFSAWALVVMGLIVVTGVWNAWNEVGGIPGLVGTPYGRLVLLKVLLLLPVIGLAASNRRSLLPRLGGEAATIGRPAMRSLAAPSPTRASSGRASSWSRRYWP